MMKASMTLGRVSSFLGLGFFITLKDLFTGKLEKEDFKNFLRKGKIFLHLFYYLLVYGIWVQNLVQY